MQIVEQKPSTKIVSISDIAFTNRQSTRIVIAQEQTE